MAAVTKIDAGLTASGSNQKKQAPELGAVMHEHVYNRLRDALITGRLTPGRALSVRGIAAEFDVSAMPAREAIRQLAAVGALEFTDTRRVSIAKMTAEKLEEIKTARLLLEPILAERSLISVAGKQREKRRLLRSLEKHDAALDAAIRRGDVSQYTQYNSAFHFELYRASGSAVLIDLVESLWLRFGPFMRVVIGRLGTSCLIDDRHKDIMEAIEAEDAKALKKAVRDDLLHGMNNIDVAEIEADT
ncbi:MAG: GntR family transcriptional regulator [Pseudomonadota bacterium]